MIGYILCLLFHPVMDCFRTALTAEGPMALLLYRIHIISVSSFILYCCNDLAFRSKTRTEKLYGGLEVAEQIAFANGMEGVHAAEGKPYVLNRGIKFNIPLDDVWRTTLPLDGSYNGTATDLVRPEHWENYEVVKTITIDGKIDFWRGVMSYAHSRGVKFYVFTWNIYTYGEQGKYGLGVNAAGEKEHQSQSVSHLEKALAYWQIYADDFSARYRPQMMARLQLTVNPADYTNDAERDISLAQKWRIR